MSIKLYFYGFVLLFSTSIISQEFYPAMILTPKLSDEDEKAILDLVKNSEFKRFLQNDYKTESTTLDFDLVKLDISKVFYQCNTSIFAKYPELERPVNYFIQENIYGYPRVMDNGRAYRLVKAARDYPAMSRGIDSFFVDMASPSEEERKIYMKDYKGMPKLQSKTIEGRHSFMRYLKDKYKGKLKRKHKEQFHFVKLLSPAELSEYIYYQSIYYCVQADQLLAIHGYTNVDGIKVNTWYSARATASKVRAQANKVRAKARKDLINELKSY